MIDLLFLELSQFCKAKTRLELELEGKVADLNRLLSGFAGVPQAFYDVAAERVRQMRVEGFSSEHDDQHSYRELAAAAGCYAAHAGKSDMARAEQPGAPRDWPWDDLWWKPTTARRDLVKAAALILAEIERIDGRASTINHNGGEKS